MSLVVASCFGPLLRWIVQTAWSVRTSAWPWRSMRRAWGSLDGAVGERTRAWLCHSGRLEGAPSARQRILAALLGELAGSWKGQVPTDWLVLVLADRGLYARWLYAAIVRCGWHPFLRINLAVKVREPGEADQFDWLSRWVPKAGSKVERRRRVFCPEKESAVLHPDGAVGTRL